LGEQREQALRCPGWDTRTGRLAADFQIFQHRQVGEDAPVFRHIAQAQPRDRMGRQADDVVSGKMHPAAASGHQTHDGAQGGRFAGAIAAEQGHHLTAPGFQSHAGQDVGASVPGFEIGNAEQGVGQGSGQWICRRMPGHDRAVSRLNIAPEPR
jgi:hypothetical protein